MKIPSINRIIAYCKIRSFPGFGGVPIYTVLSFAFNELKNDELITRANSMTFSFFISIFPGIIVLITMLAYIPVEGSIEVLSNSMRRILPSTTHQFVFDTVDDLMNRRGGLLSVSFLIAIWFSSNGMLAMLRGFDKDFEQTFSSRNGIQKRLKAIQLTFLLGIILIASIVMVIAGNYILTFALDWIEADQFTTDLIFSLRWVIMIILFYVFISFVYRYGPAIKEKFSFFAPGTTFSTILCLLSSLVFSIYMNNFGMYNKIYGSIGTIIVLMLWIQINCLILLIGFEINTSILVNKVKRSIKSTKAQETKAV